MERYKLFLFSRAIKRRFYKYYNKIKFIFIGVDLGRNSKIYDKVYIECNSSANIIIGKGFFLTSGDNFNSLCSNRRASIYVTKGALLKIGDYVGMSSPTIWCASKIVIGNNAHIGANCMIIDTDVHSKDYKHRDFRNEIMSDVIPMPINIGDDVWIGLNCIILKGVTIGNRSIIGAGSVVTKDIPANCIAAGNPCRVIKYNNN